jgi:hypothetical protein
MMSLPLADGLTCLFLAGAWLVSPASVAPDLSSLGLSAQVPCQAAALPSVPSWPSCRPPCLPAAARDNRPTPAALASLNSLWNRFLSFLYTTFHSRERMIQLTLIGVIVGLFIMLRKMPGRQ